MGRMQRFVRGSICVGKTVGRCLVWCPSHCRFLLKKKRKMYTRGWLNTPYVVSLNIEIHILTSASFNWTTSSRYSVNTDVTAHISTTQMATVWAWLLSCGLSAVFQWQVPLIIMYILVYVTSHLKMARLLENLKQKGKKRRILMCKRGFFEPITFSHHA